MPSTKTWTTVQDGKLVVRWHEVGKANPSQRNTGLTDTPANRIKAKRIARELVGASDGSWEDFKERVEEEYYPDCSSKYVSMFKTVLKSLENFREPQSVMDVDAVLIREWLTSLKVRQSTKKTYLRHLKALLSFAVDCGILAAVPHVRLRERKGKEHPLRERTLSEADWKRIRDNVDYPWTTFAIDCLWYTGLRADELSRLTWNDSDTTFGITGLDTDKPTFVIRKQKNGRRQDHPMTPDCAKFLKETEYRKKSGLVVDKAYWTIVGKVGDAGKCVSVGKKFASAHDFRAAFATRWARVLKPQDLMRLMRHSSIQTTMKYYVHEEADQLREALNSVG